MKPDIHPKYFDVDARCACGATWKTRSTKPELHLEICSNCHPFFTGRQKLIDTEGRVERFTKKYGAQTVEQRKPRRRRRQTEEGRRESHRSVAIRLLPEPPGLTRSGQFRQFPIQARQPMTACLHPAGADAFGQRQAREAVRLRQVSRAVLVMDRERLERLAAQIGDASRSTTSARHRSAASVNRALRRYRSARFRIASARTLPVSAPRSARERSIASA